MQYFKRKGCHKEFLLHDLLVAVSQSGLGYCNG